MNLEMHICGICKIDSTPAGSQQREEVMICATQQPVSGSKGLERSSRNVKSLLASLRAPQHRVLGAVQFSACDSRSSGSSVSSRCVHFAAWQHVHVFLK